MTRKYTNIALEKRMKNNREKNKQFEEACKEAGLNDAQKHEFSKVLHEDKEFQTGDYDYNDLVAFAEEFRR